MPKYRLPLVDSSEIIFNSISAEDADRYYQLLVSNESNVELEEYIFNLITEDKYIDKLNTLDAGIILIVIHAAFSLSNVLTDIKDFPVLIEKARDKSDTLYAILYTKICQAMPYKIDELKAKTLDELLELFAIAENITGKPIDMSKLREAINTSVNPRSKKDQAKAAPAAELGEDKLSSLKAHLDFLQTADINSDGRFIGDMSLL